MSVAETMDHWECNAFCRGGRHAQVVNVRLDFQGKEAEALTEFCRSFGVRFVALEPATEARPDTQGERGWNPDGAGGWKEDTTPMHDVDPADYTRWLLIWEEQ